MLGVLSLVRTPKAIKTLDSHQAPLRQDLQVRVCRCKHKVDEEVTNMTVRYVCERHGIDDYYGFDNARTLVSFKKVVLRWLSMENKEACLVILAVAEGSSSDEVALSTPSGRRA